MTENAVQDGGASVEIRAVSPGGFPVALTLSGQSADVASRMQAALGWFTKNQFTPEMAAVASNGGGNGNGDAKVCQVHGVTMTAKTKNGETWHSHKVGDGWCRG